MRPRFSLKWLLIAFTVLSVCFYLFIVRPTALANKFVASVNRGELAELTELMQEAAYPFGLNVYVAAAGPPHAELLPRTWDDIRSFRRRVAVGYYSDHTPAVINWAYLVYATPTRTTMEPSRLQR